MEWYWWVIIVAAVVMGGYIKIKVLKGMFSKKNVREEE